MLRNICVIALVFLALAHTACALDQYITDEDRFPGWRGELPSSIHTEFQDSVGYGELGKEVWRGKIEQISWKPRAFLLHNFLSDEECDHLIAISNSSLRKSTVVDSKTGSSIDSDVRTSSGTFLSTHFDDIVTRIEKRLALVTMIPEENGESLQILKYEHGQKYEPHTDYFHDSVNSDPRHGGQRLATVLMYLTTPEEGGETVFPYAEKKVEGDGWSECAHRGLAVKATKGNALFFYSLNPDGTADSTSTHGSCPTLKGVKYSATKWIHVGVFNKRLAEGSLCKDEDNKCAEWAAMGECKKNAGYMLNNCRMSCNACSPSEKLRARLNRKVGG